MASPSSCALCRIRNDPVQKNPRRPLPAGWTGCRRWAAHSAGMADGAGPPEPRCPPGLRDDEEPRMREAREEPAACGSPARQGSAIMTTSCGSIRDDEDQGAPGRSGGGYLAVIGPAQCDPVLPEMHALGHRLQRAALGNVLVSPRARPLQPPTRFRGSLLGAEIGRA